MKTSSTLRTLLIFTIMTLNIGCDQLSKSVVRNRVQDNEKIHFVNDRLTLTRVENSGAFLSLGHSLPKAVKTILLTIIPLIVIVFASLYTLTKENLSGLTVTGICFVIGGGIGNIYDRIVYGSVTDFLHIDFGIFQTGVFNMADVSIMTGISIILFEFSGLRRI